MGKSFRPEGVSPVRPALTNVSARYTLTGGRPESRVTLETTERPEVLVGQDGSGNLELVLPGVACAMAAGAIPVRDGLVRQVEVRSDGNVGTRVSIHLDHVADYVVRSEPGLPFRTVVVVDRAHLSRLLSGRLILLDPGHGGADPGARGPINLREREKCWEVTLFASQFLREAGAVVMLTRRPEENPSEALRRSLAKRRGAHLYISLHLGTGRDSAERGTASYALGKAPDSLRLARCIHRAVLDRFPLPDRGIRTEQPVDLSLVIPAVRVEPVTLTNGLDEALLRSPIFKRGLGLAVLTGVKDFLDGET